MKTDTHFFIYVSADFGRPTSTMRFTLATNAGSPKVARAMARRRKRQKREDGERTFASVVICRVECPRGGGTAVKSGPLALGELPGTLLNPT